MHLLAGLMPDRIELTMCNSKCTSPVEVVDDPDFTVIILQVIADVVLFDVRADVFLHSVIFVFPELQSALQYKQRFCKQVSN